MDDKMMYVTIALGVLLSISEGLTLIPSLKSNGVLQLAKAIIGKLYDAFRGKEELKDEPK